MKIKKNYPLCFKGFFQNGIFALAIAVFFSMCCNRKNGMDRFPGNQHNQRKPVIYLYPQQKEQVSVKIDLKGTFTLTEPAYKNGWNVIAEPDGKILDPADGKNYPYLFWEATTSVDYKMNEGFVVEGSKTRLFLDSILPLLGLYENEKAEFISYWNPIMEKNKFNKIYFAGKEYTGNAELKIIPKPDVLTRVFMVFKKCDSFEKIPAQKISIPEKRRGFTVIEWGGANLDETSEENP